MPIVIKFLEWFLSRAVVITMVLLVLTVSLQVFMRYVVSSPVTFTEELSRYLLIWVGLLSASYAYRQRMHLALDLLILKLSGRSKMILNIFIHSMILLFAITVLLYGGYELTYMVIELGQSSPSLGISMGFVYLSLPVSGLAISIYAVDFIRMELSGPSAAVNPDLPSGATENLASVLATKSGAVQSTYAPGATNPDGPESQNPKTE
jgi:TRAP-type C4-dicarboxylate transport system permease small subunit